MRTIVVLLLAAGCSSPAGLDITASTQPGAATSAMIVPDEYVRVVLVNDTARFAGFGSVAAVEDDALERLKEANFAWLQGDLPRNIQFIAAAQVTWTDGDPFTPNTAPDGKTDVASLLSVFSSWWSTEGPASGQAIGVLLTGRELQNDLFGYGGIGTVCGTSATTLVRTTASFNALAHMLGHSFGMMHDSAGNPCPATGFVMAATHADGPTPVHFSTCSSDYLTSFLISAGASVEGCFQRPPQRDALATESWCGDGVVQPGEQCDCGAWCDADPCCLGPSCLFQAGATCSAGERCCDPSLCQPYAVEANVTCRPAQDACDVVELCAGSSACGDDELVSSCGGGDYAELCPDDPAKLSPGVCGCGAADTDTDGDQLADCLDRCVNDPAKLSPGACGCGALDTDTDGDGTADCVDLCPDDPAKVAPGVCGCGVADTDTDTDGDGTPDCRDVGDDDDDDDDAVGDEGCACQAGPGLSPWLGVLLLVLLRLRRERSRR